MGNRTLGTFHDGEGGGGVRGLFPNLFHVARREYLVRVRGRAFLITTGAVRPLRGQKRTERLFERCCARICLSLPVEPRRPIALLFER